MASAQVAVSTRAVSPPPRWELSVRYVAAYACTLLAVLAAWPRIMLPFALLLVATTLLGLPLSLALRRSGLRIGRYRIIRPLFNGFVLATTMLASGAYLWFSLGQMTGGVDWKSGVRSLLENPNRGIELLIGVFLLFAVCRCLFILTDKDALLCTVPSFSVLLLLIVVQREATIVFYFLMWSLATAILLALDHRGEARYGLSATVPAVVPGQEVSLPARSLGGVIVFSLLCSAALAYGLASTGSQSRSPGENWIIEMVSRWSNLAADSTEVSSGSSLSRRIDFSSGPPLPSRRVVWLVRAESADGKRQLQPALWRSFTLSNYDGQSWTVASNQELQRVAVTSSRLQIAAGTVLPNRRRRSIRERGYNVRARQAKSGIPPNRFGTRGQRIIQKLVAQTSSTGFLPCLPAAEWVMFGGAAPGHIEAGNDASLETLSLQPQDQVFIQSLVPPALEYGTGSQLPPMRRRDADLALRLNQNERRANLQLPALPPRVRDLPSRILQASVRDESAVRQAQKLALWIQNRASYTLRPPATRSDRDATDFFLFDSRRGYCTYFAGALAVLCRARGIPARVVAGYANPEWAVVDAGDPQNNEPAGTIMGRLREANGHAWTEVWQDGWGWTPVDATPADDRGDNAPGMLAESGDWVGSFLARAWKSVAGVSVWLWRHPLWLGCSLPFLFALQWLQTRQVAATPITKRLVSWLSQRRRQKTPLASSDEAARAAIKNDYARAARELSRRFRPRASGETSREWLRAAESALNLRDAEPLRTLTDMYERASYRWPAVDENDQSRARRALSNLSWKKVEERPETKSPAT